jgi:hypothetical protein
MAHERKLKGIKAQQRRGDGLKERAGEAPVKVKRRCPLASSASPYSSR